VDGDHLLYIIATDRNGRVGCAWYRRHAHEQSGLEHACGKLDIPFQRAAVGDRYVLIC
jgi:phosphoglucosamine mutase